MTAEQRTFIAQLTASTETHEEWLAIVRFGLGTLLDDQEAFAKLIGAEAARMVQHHLGTTEGLLSDSVALILKELGLKLTQ